MTDRPYEEAVTTAINNRLFEEEWRKKIQHHPSKHDGIVAKHEDFREAVFKMGLIIETLVPDCTERDTALTKLEEVMFWSNAGIARSQE